MTDQIQPDGNIRRLGGCGVNRSDAEVVDVPIGVGRIGLLHRVRGAPDQRVVMQVPTCLARRHIALPDVQHIGLTPASNLRGVVHHHQAAHGRHATHLGDRLRDCLGGSFLVPHLQQVDAAREHSTHEVEEIALLRTQVGT